jgi:hypothetical protein
MDTKYNGWTNYATWRVNLEYFDSYDSSVLPRDTYQAMDCIKNEIENYIDETTPDGLGKDYALAFISDVNFYEIAEHLISESEE